MCVCLFFEDNKVEVNYRNTGVYLSAKITGVREHGNELIYLYFRLCFIVNISILFVGLFDIVYEDGEVENNVTSYNIRYPSGETDFASTQLSTVSFVETSLINSMEGNFI